MTSRRLLSPFTSGSRRGVTGIICRVRDVYRHALSLIFGRPFVKRFALCYRTVVLSVCLSVLSVTLMYCGQNGWMDRDETWHAGRPRPWSHCFTWGPSSLSHRGHSPQFSAHIGCGQMAGWIKMPLGMEVGLGPGDFVLHGQHCVRWGPSFPQKKGTLPPNFWPMSSVADRMDG